MKLRRGWFPRNRSNLFAVLRGGRAGAVRLCLRDLMGWHLIRLPSGVVWLIIILRDTEPMHGAMSNSQVEKCVGSDPLIL